MCNEFFKAHLAILKWFVWPKRSIMYTQERNGWWEERIETFSPLTKGGNWKWREVINVFRIPWVERMPPATRVSGPVVMMRMWPSLAVVMITRKTETGSPGQSCLPSQVFPLSSSTAAPSQGLFLVNQHPLAQWAVTSVLVASNPWRQWLYSASTDAQTAPTSRASSFPKLTLKVRHTWKRKCVHTIQSQKRRFDIRGNAAKLQKVGKMRKVWFPAPAFVHALLGLALSRCTGSETCFFPNTTSGLREWMGSMRSSSLDLNPGSTRS